MTATSYANLSFCCTCLPQKTRHHNLKNTSRHINLSRNRAFEDPHTKKGKEGENSKVVSNSGRVAICVSTAGYDAVRSHRENVFETPILISSHSGSRTPLWRKGKKFAGSGKDQFKATCLIGDSRCSRQTIHSVLPKNLHKRSNQRNNEEWWRKANYPWERIGRIQLQPESGYFLFHFLGNVKLPSRIVNRK